MCHVLPVVYTDVYLALHALHTDVRHGLNFVPVCCSDEAVKMSSQPQQVAVSADGYVAVACLNEIVILQNGRLLCTEAVKYEPSSVSISPNQTEVAVGGKSVSLTYSC